MNQRLKRKQIAQLVASAFVITLTVDSILAHFMTKTVGYVNVILILAITAGYIFYRHWLFRDVYQVAMQVRGESDLREIYFLQKLCKLKVVSGSLAEQENKLGLYEVDNYYLFDFRKNEMIVSRQRPDCFIAKDYKEFQTIVSNIR